MNYDIKPTDGIRRIVGIYHADGGIVGEIKYFAGNPSPRSESTFKATSASCLVPGVYVRPPLTEWLDTN